MNLLHEMCQRKAAAGVRAGPERGRDLVKTPPPRSPSPPPTHLHTHTHTELARSSTKPHPARLRMSFALYHVPTQVHTTYEM